MSFREKLWNVMIAHKQGLLETEEADKMLMESLAECYIPAAWVGHEIQSVDYAVYDVRLADKANRDFNIAFECSGGSVLCAYTDKDKMVT